MQDLSDIGLSYNTAPKLKISSLIPAPPSEATQTTLERWSEHPSAAILPVNFTS